MAEKTMRFTAERKMQRNGRYEWNFDWSEEATIEWVGFAALAFEHARKLYRRERGFEMILQIDNDDRTVTMRAYSEIQSKQKDEGPNVKSAMAFPRQYGAYCRKRGSRT